MTNSKCKDWVTTSWGKQMCTYLAHRGGRDFGIQEELIFLDKEFQIER